MRIPLWGMFFLGIYTLPMLHRVVLINTSCIIGLYYIIVHSQYAIIYALHIRILFDSKF